MSINLIANVVFHKNHFLIGIGGNLLVKIKSDLEYFKNLTKTCQFSAHSKLDMNVIVMGSQTWKSIGCRSLPNRINIVLTNDKYLLKIKWTDTLKFMTIKKFEKFYKKNSPTVYVIGGGAIYNFFLNNEGILKPHRLFLTEVSGYTVQHDLSLYVTFKPINFQYKLISSSQKNETENGTSYRFLMYHLASSITDEFKYIDLCRSILRHGKSRIDRTGVGTVSTFGKQVHFDISHTVPLLTTKMVPWKVVIEELLWFMRGDTDATILHKKGIKIWDGNSSREYLDSHGLDHYQEGVLGPVYGWQWRFFGKRYNPKYADSSNIDRQKIGGFDQLAYIEYQLKTNPYSRQIFLSAWNPSQLAQMALPPCHVTVQFYVDPDDLDPHPKLNCHFTMRSNDVFLGHPFNIFSYAVLTYILALRCNMRPGKLVYTGGDVHIYKNHIDQVNLQISRMSRPLPCLVLNPEIKYKKYEDIKITDFEVIGYFPHPMIKAPMAV